MVFWRSRQGVGVLIIVATTLCFALLDTLTKRMAQLVPVLLLLWFRYAFQALVTFALRWRAQGLRQFQTANPRFQVLRGVLLLITSACSFLGLQHLPVGEFTAIVMLSPLAATAMAAVVLQNRVSAQRWWLLMLGLVGVVLVVRPGGTVFSWALLYPITMVFAYGWFQVLTSRLSGEENPYTTQLYTGLVGALIMTPVAAFHWSSDALLQHGLGFIGVGFFGTFGHFLLIKAYERASAPVLMPYMYVQIAFATGLGWWVFDHVPDRMAIAGIGVIALAGVGNAVLAARSMQGRG